MYTQYICYIILNFTNPRDSDCKKNYDLMR